MFEVDVKNVMEEEEKTKKKKEEDQIGFFSWIKLMCIIYGGFVNEDTSS